MLSRDWSITELSEIFYKLAQCSYVPEPDGNPIYGCELIVPKGFLVDDHTKFPAIIAQLHGNEPAGLALYPVLKCAAETNAINAPVLFVIGTPDAARQYFNAWLGNPDTSQASRDIFRAGVDEKGLRFADPNRIPLDYESRIGMERTHWSRTKELERLSNRMSAALDIHTARGNLRTIMMDSEQHLLNGSPILSKLEGIDQAIGTPNNSLSLAGLFSRNVPHVCGIEAGTHEASESFRTAVAVGLTYLSNLGVLNQPVPKSYAEVKRYHVRKAIRYADLLPESERKLEKSDRIYQVKKMYDAKDLPEAGQVIASGSQGDPLAVYSTQEIRNLSLIGPFYVVHQYEELEQIEKGQVVAVSVPSGQEFVSQYNFSGVFVSKKASDYNDPTVSPWPFDGDGIDQRFAYECIHVSQHRSTGGLTNRNMRK